MATTLTPKASPASAPSSPEGPTAPSGSPRRRWVIAAGLLAVVAAVGIAVAVADSGDSPDPAPAPATSAPAGQDFGSADAAEQWLVDDAGAPSGSDDDLRYGSVDARERWTADETPDTQPEVEHPTTVRPF